MNDLDIGFMSSGYSSQSGDDDLPSARRIDAVLRELGRPGGASYFFVGGRVASAGAAAARGACGRTWSTCGGPRS
ncbi:hypothetical protein SMICM17S_04047 [Streptomyces microflavus]